MHTLSAVQPIANYKLECIFDDGTKKIADLSSYLESQAFKPLLQPNAFNKISNNQYFVEWAEFELDLSADTLWHIGKKV
jgi:hypothetical protein